MFNEKNNYQYPGDMVKSVYDSNDDGVVNAADSVPWTGVTGTPDDLQGYGISDVPVSLLDGVIGLEHIPPSAVERMKTVADDTARFALTTADVQNGDTVKVVDTDKMYLVIDDGNLDSEAGYTVYVAGRAAAVDWSGVESKPDTLDGYGVDLEEEVSDLLDDAVVTSDAENPVVLETASAQFADLTHIAIEPIQDLHGYDHPWPAGGGKNLSPVSEFLMGGASAFVQKEFTAGTYTVSFDATTSGVNISFQFRNGENTSTIVQSGTSTVAGRINITLSLSETAGGFRFFSDGSITITNVQLELGSTATAFSPYSNICPISGLDEVEIKRTGKNLLDPELFVHGRESHYNANADGSITVKDADYSVWGDIYTIVLKAGTYTLSWKTQTLGTIRLRVSDDDYSTELLVNASAKEYTFTLQKDGGIRFKIGLATNYPYTEYLMISPNQNSTVYEPYTSNEVTSSLHETVYGGTLDLETGVLNVTHASVDLGTLNWSYVSAQNMFVAALSQSSLSADIVNSHYKKFASFSDLIADTTTIGIYKATDTNKSLYIRDTAYFDAASFKTAMSGVQLVYELATPQTYQLTPHQLSLLKGTNVISVNGKTVQVTYRTGKLATLADAERAVSIADEHIAEALQPILGNLADIETSPATSGHAVGSYLIYDGKLYKVLSAILAGEPLTVGTNISQTTVMAELITLTS